MNAYQYGLKLLAQRDYSEFKLREKILSKKFAENEVAMAIDELRQKAYLREEEYLRGRIRKFVIKGHGNKAIMMKLKQENLNTTMDFIQEVREEEGISESESIRDLYLKKMRSRFNEGPVAEEESERVKQKTIAFLVGRGFSYGQVHQVLNSEH